MVITEIGSLQISEKREPCMFMTGVLLYYLTIDGFHEFVSFFITYFRLFCVNNVYFL